MNVPTIMSRRGHSIKMRRAGRGTVICQTGSVTDPVTAARAALDRAEATVTRRRDELAHAIADAIRAGERLSHVGRRAKYTPEHIRRIARAHGIEDTTGREPPAPKRPRTAVED